jgi:hypothetical protein
MLRGFIALLLLALLAINLLNFWQIQQLQQQVAALQSRVHHAESADTALTSLLGNALPALSQAREAMQHADFDRARRLLHEATDRADQISRTLGDKAGPAVAWLRQQAQSLEDQMQKK